MKHDENERKFFFAMSESKLYDATIRLTVPYYDLIHKTLIDILNYHFGVSYGVSNTQVEGVFLDVGAGTGKESLSILKAFPKLNVLAIDLAAPMKEEFSKNYEEIFGKERLERFSFLVEDILELDFGVVSRDVLKQFADHRRVAAVSAYCIHHFELDKKREIYQKMFDYLEDGGVMANLDLFNYRSDVFSKHAHDFDVEYITRQFENPNPEFTESVAIPSDIRKKLSSYWVAHMENDNILHPVETHLEILRRIGFRHVECVFKYFQQGIVVAVK